MAQALPAWCDPEAGGWSRLGRLGKHRNGPGRPEQVPANRVICIGPDQGGSG